MVFPRFRGVEILESVGPETFEGGLYAVSISTPRLFDIDELTVYDPLGYLEFTSAMSAARMVITDSGGVQEETTLLSVPCITVRPNTERPITVTHGTNQLTEPDGLPDLATGALNGGYKPSNLRSPLWDGRTGERIASVVAGWAPNL